MTDVSETVLPNSCHKISITELDAVYTKESRYGFFGWFKKAVISGFSTYGRARRKEFWWFVFGCLLLECVAGTISYGLYKKSYTGLYIPFLVGNLLIAYPFFTVSVRRLHDIGRSGWWFLLWIVPSVIATTLLGGVNYFFSDAQAEANPLPVTAISLLWVLMISGWIAIFVMMMVRTSDKMNKYGLPAKRVGKKTAIKNSTKNNKQD